MERFFRTRILLGEEKLERLGNSSCAVIGLGAVGSFCCEILARTGIGKLIICDHDVIQQSNINRQLFALESTINKKKSDVAEQRLLDINPNLQIVKHSQFINGDNFNIILDEKPDAIVDAIDSVRSKADIIQQSVENNIYVISSMGAALKTNPLKIHYSRLDRTTNCPLARNLRKELKKRGASLKIPCVFTDEQAFSNPFHKNTKEAGLGSIPTVTAIFGIYLANKVIEELLANENRSS
ncbi:MAG: tRNA threonylcarbamoyladenosine dehydratase [Spirochaetales bacterium]|nr:tRNA threonylcarbamoyladenosine dehydratase [Spirochaetales bacterium]